MNLEALELERVTVWRGERRVFHDFSLKIRADERLAILGANGAGKSTLLEILCGTVRCAATPEGKAKLFGERLWSLEDLRGRMGMLVPAQAEMIAKHEEVEDAVLSVFRKAYGVTRQMEFLDQERAATRRAMAMAGVGQLGGRLFSTLSSGEKTRTLLARALVHDPQLLVLDEPCTALDLPGSWGLLETIGELARAGKGVLMVTHDVRELIPEIERVVLLKNGRVLADGKKDEVLTSENLSECYSCPVKVREEGGRISVWPGR